MAIEASGFEKTYTAITRAVLEDENVDAVIAVMGANNWLDGKSVPGLFADIRRDFPQKTLLAVSMPGDRKIYYRMQREFKDIGVPCYTKDEDAVASLAALYRYRQYLNATP